MIQCDMTIKNFLCLILLQFTLVIGLWAQSETKPVPEDEDAVAPMQSGSPSSVDGVYTVVDEMPEYPGGIDQLNKDIEKISNTRMKNERQRLAATFMSRSL